MSGQLKIDKSIIPRKEGVLHRYLSEVDRQRMVSTSEEVELAKRIRQGDKAALDRLVCANLRFVISVAKRYQHMGMPLSDLVSEGNVGLIKAALKFDETKGFKFISYAVWWIRQSILFALDNQLRTVRLPASVTKGLMELRQKQDLLEQRLERKLTVEELSEIAPRFDPNDLGFAELLGRTKHYLDDPCSEDGTETLVDRIADTHMPLADQQLMVSELGSELKALINKLEPLERTVILESFGFNELEVARTMDEISGMLGLNSEAVGRIRKLSIHKLRQAMESGEVREDRHLEKIRMGKHNYGR